VLAFCCALLYTVPATGQDSQGYSTLEIRTRSLGGEEVSAEAYLDSRRLGITPYLDEVPPGRYRLEVKAAEGEWWGSVRLRTDEAESVDVVVVPFPAWRIAVAGSGGGLVYSDDVFRQPFGLEGELGLRLGPIVFNLAAVGFAEEPHHMFVRPGLQWYPVDDWVYIRAGFPVQFLEEFNVGGTLGPGVRFGRRHFAFFFDITATLFFGPGERTLPVEGRLGAEVLF